VLRFVLPAQSAPEYDHAIMPAGLVKSNEFLNQQINCLPAKNQLLRCIVSSFFPFVLHFGEKLYYKIFYCLSFSACKKLESEVLNTHGIYT